MRYSKFLFIVILAGCSKNARKSPQAPAPVPVVVSEKTAAKGSAKLIREMHDRYAGKWYRTLTFQQTNTFYTSGGREEKSEWIQRLSVPGRLRIDFLPLAARSGLLIQNNRVITFDNGRRIDTRRAIQPVLTLTGDVYAMPASIILRRLDSLGVDLDKFHEEKWEGKRAYVMGAELGDLASNQIWIDAGRLLLVRFIQRDKRADRTVTTDTRVGDYREVEGYAIAFEFTSYRDGKLFFKEKYGNLKVNEPIPAGVFDASKWATVQAAAR